MQPKELTDEQKKEVEKRIHRSACFQRAFKGRDGEFALKEISALGKYDTFDPDPYVSAYKAGQRAVVLFINKILDQDVEQARKTLLERNENAS